MANQSASDGAYRPSNQRTLGSVMASRDDRSGRRAHASSDDGASTGSIRRTGTGAIIGTVPVR